VGQGEIARPAAEQNPGKMDRCHLPGEKKSPPELEKKKRILSDAQEDAGQERTARMDQPSEGRAPAPSGIILWSRMTAYPPKRPLSLLM